MLNKPKNVYLNKESDALTCRVDIGNENSIL